MNQTRLTPSTDLPSRRLDTASSRCSLLTVLLIFLPSFWPTLNKCLFLSFYLVDTFVTPCTSALMSTTLMSATSTMQTPRLNYSHLKNLICISRYVSTPRHLFIPYPLRTFSAAMLTPSFATSISKRW